MTGSNIFFLLPLPIATLQLFSNWVRKVRSSLKAVRDKTIIPPEFTEIWVKFHEKIKLNWHFLPWKRPSTFSPSPHCAVLLFLVLALVCEMIQVTKQTEKSPLFNWVSFLSTWESWELKSTSASSRNNKIVQPKKGEKDLENFFQQELNCCINSVFSKNLNLNGSH